MSERIQTPITGITTTSDYTEGDTYSQVNARFKNGALHPVSPRKVIQELSQQYDIVFVHQNNEYKNWLGVINGDNYSSVYWDVRDEQPQIIASNISGKINSVQQIGNTVSLITEDNIYYLFYQNGKYIYLGEIPQIPVITLSTHEQAHIKYYFFTEYGENTVTPDNFIDSTKGLVYKAMDILMNGYTDKNSVWHDGLGFMLFDACFIRYAYRLYDGTLTKHSPPILFMPSRHIVGKEGEGNMESIKTISYDFDDNLRKGSCVDVYGNKIALSYDLSMIGNDNYEKWEDIIKSVDIFLSAPLGISNIENIRTDMPTTDSPRTLNYNLIKGLSAEALKKVSNTSTFYLIRSIELGKKKNILDPEIFPTTESDISKIENLIYQEVMTDDNFSNHKYGARHSYAYNNRLHLANIKTTFFNGFNPDYFRWLSITNSEYGGYNSVKYTDVPGDLYSDLLIEVQINTGITNEKVYSYLKEEIRDAYKVFMSAFISYPDPRANKITIYRKTALIWYKVFSQPLEKHKSLNLAFYVDGSLNPVIEIIDPASVQLPDTSKIVSITESNKIKVSDLNNPLRFPNVNVYLTGNGTILSMATNAMLVSDRNYGQYPLYVFTTQGIWTLNVGSGEVVYSTQSAPTSQKTPISSFVCETPLGVVFITTKGLNLINNNQDVFISPQIEETPLRLNIETSPHCDHVVFSPEYKSFKELIPSIKSIIYNPKEDEIIINTDSELNYVLSLEGSIFYQSTERIDQIVNNTFPELYVINTNKVIDYSLSENTVTHVSLILRPLKYGTPDIKRLERMILRGIFYNIKNPDNGKFSLVMIHASNDNVNFRCMRALSIREGNHKDNDLGLLAATKYRQVLFTFAGMMDDNSQIQYLESMVDKQYDNTKMR